MRPLPLLLLVALACAVGPKYTRPRVDAPPSYRGAPEATPGASIGDERWDRVFPDPALDALLREAVANNQDVLIAATRIEQAEAQLGITRADQLPSASVAIAGGRQRLPATAATPAVTTNVLQGTGVLSWELDFWGRFRRATEAARADLLAAEWSRSAVITSLVSAVASSYYQLLELDLELKISRSTLTSRRESLVLTQLQERQGAVSILDVRQAEQLVYNATQTIIDAERRTEQQENFLSMLLGRNPGPIARGRKLTEQPHDPVVPAGYRRRSCSGGPTSSSRRRGSSPPTPASASRGGRTSPPSRSRRPAVRRAPRSPICSRDRPVPGASSARSRSRSSRAAGSARA
jgi:outer membrane protein, multidrug efflux system